MRRQLRDIERRRTILFSRAHNQRLALSENRVWTSGPLMIIDYLLSLKRGIDPRSSIMQYGAVLLAASFPNKTIRLASRSMMILMMLNSIRKKILQ